ncbi:hypothetical protein MHH96_09635 [Niallia sp. FSL K6-0212]|jgi:hypothetical protein|uniref:hypothetical protein n=1 Tax=Niallia TaxID=2837506 RepID=UPI002E223A55|nr:hypothetical protein [Niallia circulans]
MVFYLIDEGAGEMTLLEGVKVTICEREGKRGVHGGDENHNPGRPRKKWCSSSG